MNKTHTNTYVGHLATTSNDLPVTVLWKSYKSHHIIVHTLTNSYIKLHAKHWDCIKQLL